MQKFQVAYAGIIIAKNPKKYFLSRFMRDFLQSSQADPKKDYLTSIGTETDMGLRWVLYTQITSKASTLYLKAWVVRELEQISRSARFKKPASEGFPFLPSSRTQELSKSSSYSTS